MKNQLLDTDTISYFLKGIPEVEHEMQATFERDGILFLSVITYYEILNGLFFKNAQKQLSSFQEFLKKCQILPLNNQIAELGAEIYADLRKKNQMIGHTDVLIGATALHHKMKIVTNNQAHFSRISNLELENWYQS
jgi:tRNA(fMet)-specific endonuclease VapC